MDILANLRRLLGIEEEQPKQQTQRQRVDIEQNMQAQPEVQEGQVRFEDGSVGTPYADAPRRNLQAPSQLRLRPNSGDVTGSVNPTWQVQRGNTPYSPGEGPRTIFDELLRRR